MQKFPIILLISIFIIALLASQAAAQEGVGYASLEDAVQAELGVAFMYESKLLASDGAEYDEFGSSVSISGDTAVVGVPRDDGTPNDSGSAYVFTFSGNNWSQAAKLTPSDGIADGHFGHAVSVSGDTVVVGTYRANAVYVFVKPGSGWATTSTYTAKLTASDGVSGDNLGRSVAIDSGTLVAGAASDDSSKGSAYVFTGSGSSWTQVAKLTASDAATSDSFGGSVAVNASTAGVADTVVVGANADDDHGSSSGSAYVFVKPGTGWTTATENAKLTTSDGGEDEHFGEHVSISGQTIAVVADDVGNEKGAVYLYVKPGTGWATTSTCTAKLTGADYTGFGSDAAISGDTVVVGAYYINSQTGAAYIFDKPGSGWASTSTYTEKLTASEGEENDSFGLSVGISGNSVIVGAPYDDDKGSYSGSAYVMARPTVIKKTFTSWKKYDGTIRESTETSNTGGWMDSTSTTCMVGDDWKDRQYRAILHFATGGLPDDAVVTQARLAVFKESFTGARPFKTHGKLWADIRKKGWSNNIALELNDFAAGASKNKIGTLKYVDGTVYRGLLKSDAFPFINLLGNTQFRVRFGVDDNDDMGKDTFNFYCGDYATVSKRPKLVVWYYIP